MANAWMNRLAEASAPTGEIFPPVAAAYAPDAPVARAGLTGPVILKFFAGQENKARLGSAE